MIHMASLFEVASQPRQQSWVQLAMAPIDGPPPGMRCECDACSVCGRGVPTEGHTASLSLSLYLSVYLSICLSVYLSICLSVYLSIYLR